MAAGVVHDEWPQWQISFRNCQLLSEHVPSAMPWKLLERSSSENRGMFIIEPLSSGGSLR
jgi:hypothetical protein